MLGVENVHTSSDHGVELIVYVGGEYSIVAYSDRAINGSFSRGQSVTKHHIGRRKSHGRSNELVN